MKKLLITMIALVGLLTAFSGCVQGSKHSVGSNDGVNTQQDAFYKFLLSAEKRLNGGFTNEIQKKEFYRKFEADLFHYVDSVGIFVNWRGVIYDIETEESGNSVALKFTIEVTPPQSNGMMDIRLFATHLIPKDSLEADYLYNTVSNIPNYKEVYVDGFIRTKNTDKVYYHSSTRSNSTSSLNPDYNFWVLDIGTKKREDALSENLSNTIALSYEWVAPLKEAYLGNISKKEQDARTDKILPAFKEAKSKLNEYEAQYIQRLNTALVYNFMYGE